MISGETSAPRPSQGAVSLNGVIPRGGPGQGETVTDLVKGHGFGWERAEGARREADDVNRAVLRAAFNTEVPAGSPVFTGIQIGNSDYAVIRVANILTPAAGELASSEVAAVQQELIKDRMTATWREFLAALRAASEVKIYAKNL